jgi:hypothetical protein
MKNPFKYLIELYFKYKMKRKIKKKLEELKKRDPFVYKNF